MPLRRLIVRQASRPRGWLSPFASFGLNFLNRPMNRAAIALLDPQPGERVLDVGFGGGVSLPLLARRVGSEGSVAAIDASPEMVAKAKRRHPRLDVQAGVAERLPWPDACFDAALSVNSLYYWDDVQQGLRELRRVLRPCARLVVGVRPPRALEAVGLLESGHRTFTIGQLAAALEASGFEDVREVRPSLGILLAAARAPG